MPAFEIRPRRATELVDASFQLLRRFYPQMLTVSAIAMAPSVFLRIVMKDRLSDPTKMVENAGVFGTSLLLSSFCIAIADAVLVVAASDGYLEGSVDLARALGVGVRRIFSVIGAAFVRGLAVFLPIVMMGIVTATLLKGAAGQPSTAILGLLAFLLVILLFAWTIVAALRTFAMTSAVILEHRAAIPSLSRSWQLSKDCKAHIFFSLGLAWLLYFVIVMIATAVGQLFLSTTLVGILSTILIIPIYPLLAIVSTLLYYDLRIRKEGFDLEIMSRDLGAATAPAAAPAL